MSKPELALPVETALVTSTTERGVPRLITIRAHALIALYALVPLCGALMLADSFVFQHAVRNRLPVTPNALFGFTAVFVLPHIFASLFTFADSEYLSIYRNQLIGAVLGIAALMAALRALGGDALNLVLWATTLWHVLAQQTGIARVFMRPGQVQSAWRWTSVSAFTGVGVALFVPVLMKASLALLGLSTVLCVFVVLSATSRAGAWYVAATQALAILAAAGVLSGYTFFAILVPRIVHDVTGFMFYVAHDHNRNRVTRHNFLLRVLAFLPGACSRAAGFGERAGRYHQAQRLSGARWVELLSLFYREFHVETERAASAFGARFGVTVH
jgi:hypothetical protein